MRSRIPARLLREAAKIEEHFAVLGSAGSLEMLRCHHANKLSRNSEQERTPLVTEDKKTRTRTEKKIPSGATEFFDLIN